MPWQRGELHRAPELLIHDRYVLSRVGLPLVDDHAAIDRVLEQVEQAAPPEGDAATMWSADPPLDLGADAFLFQLNDQGFG